MWNIKENDEIMDVFITKIAKFLPNLPVNNDEMESILGLMDGSKRVKNIILRRNGIKQRYYAIDKLGNITHSNAELTFEAIKELISENLHWNDIELLSTGTSSPDQIMPSHSVMVQGLMGVNASMEVNTVSGNCTSGMNALKYAFMTLKLGEKNNAVVAGSERMSSWMIHNKFNTEFNTESCIEEKPVLSFNKEFLRWMLSDGASALFLQNKPNPQSDFNIKIEWIDGISYANEVETCMYSGGDKLPDGSLKPWSNFSAEEWAKFSIFAVKQDVKLLDQHIIEKGVKSLQYFLEKYHLRPEEIDYFLPHISSFYFKDQLMEGIRAAGMNISDDKLFINLDRVGNVGAGSIFLMLEELINDKGVKKGERILLSVPESARFNYVYALLTIV